MHSLDPIITYVVEGPIVMSPHFMKQTIVIVSCLLSSSNIVTFVTRKQVPLQSENEKSFVAIHTISPSFFATL
jgi:hypothetical protein